MLKNTVLITLAFLLLCSGLSAAEKTVTGRIEATDGKRTITCNGKSLIVSPKTRITDNGISGSLSNAKVGEQATIVYDDSLDVALTIAIGPIPANNSVIKSLEGTWVCTAAEEVGRKHNQMMLNGQNRRITIKRHRLKHERAQGFYSGMFDIDPTTNSFDFVGKSPSGEYVEWIGIYKLEGDKLTLCYRYQKDGAARRPIEFKTDSKKPNISVCYTFKKINN